MRSLRVGLVGLATLGALGAAAGCQQPPVNANVRSLERSGQLSFVCLGPPSSSQVAHSLSDCSSQQTTGPDDYGPGTAVNHLYALVTQTARGEVAVVDLTTRENSVVDEDCNSPGANFLPVGGSPQGIASTPGGNATFVGTAEVGKRGLFALPSQKIRPPVSCAAVPTTEGATTVPPTTLSEWPSCSLPSAPGQIVLAVDPAKDGRIRPACGAEYAELDPKNALDHEVSGRQKLVVELPALGQLVVIDAQSLLDSAPGAFAPCVIERTIALRTAVPPYSPPPPPSHGAECVDIPRAGPTVQPGLTPHPAGVTIVGGRVFVADEALPIIHDLDLSDPCTPVEREPLLPISYDDPSRAIVTKRVAVSPSLTSQFKRYLYAIDEDGLVMTFDVSDDSATRTPLVRQHPEWNPFAPRDRLRFGSPVKDIVVVAQDVPESDPRTGIAASGVRCNPLEKATVCTDTSTTCDEGTLYRTAANYDAGAGPLKLRGVFAYAVLTNGRLAVIDQDDYDAECRTPNLPTDALGCPPLAGFNLPSSTYKNDAAGRHIRTDEQSCNVFEPNQIRAGSYFIDDNTTNAGHHLPGLTAFPLLYDEKGGQTQGVVMFSPLAKEEKDCGALDSGDPSRPLTKDCPVLVVGGTPYPIGPEGLITIQGGSNNGTQFAVRTNLEEPRAQIGDQNWTVTFEGQIPGVQQNLARLDLKGDANDQIVDSTGRYCAVGVQSEAALIGKLPTLGAPAKDVLKLAELLADVVEITQDIPADTDAHWTAVGSACSPDLCRGAFGTIDQPSATRDLRILEAYQDHLSVERVHVVRTPDGKKDLAPAAQAALTKCCFPSLVSYTVRASNQWVVASDGNIGFMSHEIADPTTGACRDTCDDGQTRVNARIIAANTAALGSFFATTTRLFVNPVLRFAIGHDTAQPLRDWQFRFTTTGSFAPLITNLATDAKQYIAPQSATFALPLSQVAIVDASSEGVILVNSGTLSIGRTIF